MKASSLTFHGTLLAAIATSGLFGALQPSLAQARQGFYCDVSTGRPATMYLSSEGQTERWITWDSNFFADAGWDPATRCREVSSRLETYRVARQLKYVTVGYMNGERVICTASEKNGRCDGLIYTLKPNQDAVATLYGFFGLREGLASARSLSESGEMPYIDVRPRLGKDSNATSLTPTKVQAAPRNTTSTPQINPTQPSGGRSSDF